MHFQVLYLTHIVLDVWPSPQRAYCSWALPLSIVYVAASLLVNLAVDRVLRHGSAPLLYRGVTAATLSAFTVLGIVAHGQPTSIHGISMAILEIPSAVLIVIGNELYHRFQEPGAEVLTQWATPSSG